MKKIIIIVLLVIVAALVFSSGCSSREKIEDEEPIFADIDSDGFNEFIYVEISRNQSENYRWHYDWLLKSNNGYGTNEFSDPTTIMTLKNIPKNLIIADYNKDGINDIIFLLINRSRFGSDTYYDWNLMTALGKGNASFSNPIVLQDYETMPENLAIEDCNRDGIDDVVFLLINRSTSGKDHYYYDWQLMVSFGNQNGLSDPVIISTFDRKPGTTPQTV